MDDLINRQAAIDALECINGVEEVLRALPSAQPELSESVYQLWKRAYEAGKRSTQPEERTEERTETHACNLIDRQAAIDALSTPHGILYPIRTIEALPPAQPERKTGRWIYNSPVTMKCEQCGYVIKDWEWHKANYCAGCGADMKGEQDGTD